MKYKYKKLLYFLGLVSMLTLTGCNKDTNKDETETIETETKLDTELESETEITIENDCLENHLDENNLKTEVLSDDYKHVTDASVFYALRENFLNNYHIIDIKKYDNDYFESLVGSDLHLYRYDNPELCNRLSYYMDNLKRLYPECDPIELNKELKFYETSSHNNTHFITINLDHEIDNLQYEFEFFSRLEESTSLEQITEGISNGTTFYGKSGYFFGNITENYYVGEAYSLGSYNKININLSSGYKLLGELLNKGDYSCEDFEGSLMIENLELEDKLIVELNEELYQKIADLLTEAARENKSPIDFLKENKELMMELYGEEYMNFIEKIAGVSYTFK